MGGLLNNIHDKTLKLWHYEAAFWEQSISVIGNEADIFSIGKLQFQLTCETNIPMIFHNQKVFLMVTFPDKSTDNGQYKLRILE